jgi:hypothetical protein
MDTLFDREEGHNHTWTKFDHIGFECSDGDRYLYGNSERGKIRNPDDHFFWKYGHDGDFYIFSSRNRFGDLVQYVNLMIEDGRIDKLVKFDDAKEAMRWALDSEYNF